MEDIAFTVCLNFKLSELLEEHGDLLVSKVTESFYESDPVFEKLEEALRNNFDYEAFTEMTNTYSSFEASALVSEFVGIYADDVYVEPDNSDFENGSICVVVPCIFDVDSYAGVFV